MFKEYRYSERNLSSLSNITSYLVCFVICLFSFQDRELPSYTRWCYLRIRLVNTVHHLKVFFSRFRQLPSYILWCSLSVLLVITIHHLWFSFLVSGSSTPIYDDGPSQFYLWSPCTTCGFSFLVSGSSHPIYDVVPCQFYLWSPYITCAFSFRSWPLHCKNSV